MLHKKLKTFFSDSRRAHALFVATVFMFLFLALETIFSETSASFSGGHLVFSIELSPSKLICVFIYLSTSALVACAARYKLLLIPDFFLLLVKLFLVASGTLSLIELHRASPLLEISYFESVVENFLFSVFLLTFLLGKLLKKPKKLLRHSPFFALSALVLCFPFTLVFEIAKLHTALSVYDQHTAIALFNFVRGVLNEIVLDIPYALLILMMYFVPEKTFKAFRNHLLDNNFRINSEPKH